MVPLTLFSTIVPLPFGALGLSEGVGDQLFQLVGHPSGALNMMGFRVLTYGCGLIAACVYLANLGEVRALSASVHDLKRDPETSMSSRRCVSSKSAPKKVVTFRTVSDTSDSRCSRVK